MQRKVFMYQSQSLCIVPSTSEALAANLVLIFYVSRAKEVLHTREPASLAHESAKIGMHPQHASFDYHDKPELEDRTSRADS